MKVANIKFVCMAWLNGKIVADKFFAGETAKNNWCNNCFRKFGESVIVEVYDSTMDKLLETWAA